jgi:predicted ester cyclase
MTAESNEAIVRRLAEEGWNQGKTAWLDESYEPDMHSQSREQLKRSIITLRSGLPDLRMTIEDLVSEDDEISIHWSMHGTHAGHWPALGAEDLLSQRPNGEDHIRIVHDLEPTNRRVSIEGMSLFRLRDGRIVFQRTLIDQLSLLRQLGALPLPSLMPA